MAEMMGFQRGCMTQRGATSQKNHRSGCGKCTSFSLKYIAVLLVACIFTSEDLGYGQD